MDVLDRVAKLLALASSPEEGEARTAAQMAASLIAKSRLRVVAADTLTSLEGQVRRLTAQLKARDNEIDRAQAAFMDLRAAAERLRIEVSGLRASDERLRAEAAGLRAELARARARTVALAVAPRADQPAAQQGASRKIIRARFPGTCLRCHGPVEVDAPVYWQPGVGVAHTACASRT